MLDNDSYPEKTLRFAMEQINKSELKPCPELQTVGNMYRLANPLFPLACGVLPLPAPDEPGCLETMLANQVIAENEDFANCLQGFIDCYGFEDWDDSKMSKLRMCVIIASFCNKRPQSSLTNLWSQQGNPVDLASDHFRTFSDLLMEVVREAKSM